MCREEAHHPKYCPAKNKCRKLFNLLDDIMKQLNISMQAFDIAVNLIDQNSSKRLKQSHIPSNITKNGSLLTLCICVSMFPTFKTNKMSLNLYLYSVRTLRTIQVSTLTVWILPIHSIVKFIMDLDREFCFCPITQKL